MSPNAAGNVRVAIIHPNRHKKYNVEVPTDIPVQELVRNFVARVGPEDLPEIGRDTRPIRYRLTILRGDEEHELGDNMTIADANVQDNDILHLYAEMRAGGIG